jgi:hypothetical protein
MNFRKFLVAGALSCSLAFTGVAATSPAFAVEFSDTMGFSTETSINKLVSLGVMRFPGENFNPDAALTRGELAYMVNQVMSLSVGKKTTFKDLPAKNALYTPTLKLVNNGFLTTSQGNVKPSKGVTYAELSKVLSQGLGLKKTWTNRPVDFLFYLVKKEVLDIDTDLDAVVTREEAAVAFDKFITLQGTFNTISGVVVKVSDKGFSVNTGTEVRNLAYAPNVSVFVSGQAVTTGDVQIGSPATVVLNKKGTVAYYGGELLDAEDSTIKLSGGKWTIGTAVKELNNDAFVASLPNKPTVAFTIKNIDDYLKAGAQLSGQVFFTADNEVTALYPYIAKVEGKEITVTGKKVKVTLSSSISETLELADDVKVTIDGKEAKTTDLAAGVKATVEANSAGLVTAITVTTPAPAPKQ